MLAEGAIQIPLPELTLERVAEISAEMDGSPARIDREIWRRSARDAAATGGDSRRFTRGQHRKVRPWKGAGARKRSLSAGSVYAIQGHLNYFQDWLGRDTTVAEIDGGTLMDYRSHLLGNLKSKKWTRTTAWHYLKTVKAFIRWLWQTEVIASLPRVLDGKVGPLKISLPTPNPVVFTTDEIRNLLKAASARTKLYILLMLNCGMTQKDISDLKFEEVDWGNRRITRKRSETSDHENVPIVSYLLVRDASIASPGAEQRGQRPVLQNANGSPLRTEMMGEDGKYKKTDNVKNAFDRLCKKTGIKKPLKSLKKTSASLLRDNERFQGLEGLFLGHAPQSMSDKHYTLVPGKLLDQAILWLESQYEIGVPGNQSNDADVSSGEE